MASERDQLANCPFCGGEAYLCAWNPHRDEGRDAIIECSSCGAEMYADTEAQVIDAWNLRASAPPADVAGLIEELRQASGNPFCRDVLLKAADALAALTGERDRWKCGLEKAADLVASNAADGRDVLLLERINALIASAALGGSI